MGDKLTYNVVTEFGADNTGRDDSSPALARAVLKLAGHMGSALYFPAGIYKVGRPLVIPRADPNAPGDPKRFASNVTLFGDGSDATTLLFTGLAPTEHGIRTDITAFGLRDIKLTTEGSIRPDQATIRAQSADDMVGYNAGAGLLFQGEGNLRVRDVTFSGFMTGLHVDNAHGAQVWVTDSNFNNNLIYGLLVENLAGNAFFKSLEITGHVPVAGEPDTARDQRAVGIRINRGDGYLISDCIISGCGKAALMLKPTARTATLMSPEDRFKVLYVMLTSCQFDLPFNTVGVAEADPSFGSAVIVDGSLAAAGNPNEVEHVFRVNFTNCTATAASSNGFYFRQCSRVVLTGCSAFVNQAHGLRADAPCPHLSITGGQYYNNSRAQPGTHDGIYLGPGVTDFLISSVKAGRAGGEQQRFGINASSPTNDRYSITGSEALGYPNGAGINAQGGPSRVVAGNLL